MFGSLSGLEPLSSFPTEDDSGGVQEENGSKSENTPNDLNDPNDPNDLGRKHSDDGKSGLEAAVHNNIISKVVVHLGHFSHLGHLEPGKQGLTNGSPSDIDKSKSEIPKDPPEDYEDYVKRQRKVFEDTTLEEQSWQIFREVEEEEPFTEPAVLQEKYRNELVSRLGISPDDASKIIGNMKLESVYLEGKGWVYRKNGDS